MLILVFIHSNCHFHVSVSKLTSTYYFSTFLAPARHYKYPFIVITWIIPQSIKCAHHFFILNHTSSVNDILTNCFLITQSVQIIGKLKDNDSKACITNSLPSRIYCICFDSTALLYAYSNSDRSRVLYDNSTG